MLISMDTLTSITGGNLNISRRIENNKNWGRHLFSFYCSLFFLLTLFSSYWSKELSISYMIMFIVKSTKICVSGANLSLDRRIENRQKPRQTPLFSCYSLHFLLPLFSFYGSFGIEHIICQNVHLAKYIDFRNWSKVWISTKDSKVDKNWGSLLFFFCCSFSPFLCSYLCLVHESSCTDTIIFLDDATSWVIIFHDE